MNLERGGAAWSTERRDADGFFVGGRIVGFTNLVDPETGESIPAVQVVDIRARRVRSWVIPEHEVDDESAEPFNTSRVLNFVRRLQELNASQAMTMAEEMERGRVVALLYGLCQQREAS